MKRSELRPGNIVSYEGKIAPIYDLSREVVWFDEGSVAALIEDISPVPITEEILEKNGWEKDDVQWVLFHLIIQYDKVDNDFTIYVHQNGECNYLTEIEYVHELQHILWALGIDDNLKI